MDLVVKSFAPIQLVFTEKASWKMIMGTTHLLSDTFTKMVWPVISRLTRCKVDRFFPWALEISTFIYCLNIQIPQVPVSTLDYILVLGEQQGMKGPI